MTLYSRWRLMQDGKRKKKESLSDLRSSCFYLSAGLTKANRIAELVNLFECTNQLKCSNNFDLEGFSKSLIFMAGIKSYRWM